VSVTVKQAGELWLQRCRLDGLEAGTLLQYRQHLDLHILPFIGGVKLSKLTRPEVESFRDKLVETRSRSMAQKVLSSLKSLLSNAQRRGLVGQNAASGTKVKTASRHEKKAPIPTKDEIRALLSKTSELWSATLPWRPLVITALFTGLRASELRGLTWDYVDFEKKVIQVKRTIPIPKVEIAWHGATRRQVAHDDRSLAAAALCRRDQRLDECPFLIRQIAWTAKRSAVV